MNDVYRVDKTRRVAVIALCFTLIILGLNVFLPASTTTYDYDIIPKSLVKYSLLFIAILFLVIIIKPGYAILFAAAFFYEAILVFLDGDMMIGGVFSLLSFGIAVKYGFFRQYKRTKAILATLCVVGAVGVHCFINPKIIVRSLAELSLYVIVLIVFYMLFKDSLQNYFSTKAKKSLIIDYCLSEKESTYVLDVLRGLPAKEIASANKVTETTVRTTLSRAYKKMRISDAKQLVLMTSSIDFIP
jgi:DNA-binding CsgD family transcriptional regulator